MSTSNRETRSRRGRVVVVGGQSVGEVKRTVVRAANLFEAVGEVTLAPDAEPVDAVVIPAAMVGNPASIAVEAFRRIDPAVRLIVVAANDDEQARLRQGPNGFDEVLVQPVDDQALADAIEDTATRHAPDHGAVQNNTPLIESMPVDPAPLPVLMEAPPAAPDAPANEDLGDTDLVEAILTDPSGLRNRALQLMIQQTGWSDLAVTDTTPAGSACVELRFRRRCYGTLSSSVAEPRQLRPWAEWLARWMALDHGYREYRTMAYRDELTGAWNRRFYESFMKQVLRDAARSRLAVTVLVFDIDDFKRYNDDFGHDAGDEVLCETVRLLESVIRSGDRVCRIGGDEFVVVFADLEGPREPGSNPPETVEAIAARFQDQVCRMRFPKLGLDAPGTLSISGGLATFPWDGNDAASLLRHADQLALQSKREGKNVITFGPGMEKRSH